MPGFDQTNLVATISKVKGCYPAAGGTADQDAAVASVLMLFAVAGDKAVEVVDWVIELSGTCEFTLAELLVESSHIVNEPSF